MPDCLSYKNRPIVLMVMFWQVWKFTPYQPYVLQNVHQNVTPILTIQLHLLQIMKSIKNCTKPINKQKAKQTKEAGERVHVMTEFFTYGANEALLKRNYRCNFCIFKAAVIIIVYHSYAYITPTDRLLFSIQYNNCTGRISWFDNYTFIVLKFNVLASSLLGVGCIWVRLLKMFQI